MYTPTQAQAIEANRAATRLARKKRYRNLIGMGLGAAGLGAAFAGLPISVSLLFWAAGFVAWALLKNA